MPTVSLPDGSQRVVLLNSTILQLAEAIGAKLAKDSIAAYIDDVLVDLRINIINDCRVKILTIDEPKALEILRHDAAHILAQSLKELYGEKNIQLAIGPVIKDGFYYDISSPHIISSQDFPTIEKKMQEIINRNDPIIRKELSAEEALEYFTSIGEKYKLELIKKIKNLSAEEKISVYKQGEFIDLCRGPHAPSTGKLKSFKLLKVSGAYWLGDAKNDQLQRIYGTAWRNKKELDQYLLFQEEAKARDHRKLGQEMDLFHLQDEAQGQVFWHPKGFEVYRILESYIRNKLTENGYLEIKTPLIFDKILWEKSGHWAKFKEHMFTINTEDRELALKPMSCPAHIQVFNQHIRSYKDLPLRFAEFGACHRNEASGALHGLMRVRSFTQDDAHIFVTEEQIKEETKNFCQLLIAVYKEIGFEEVKVKFSDRPAQRIGEDSTWDKAELALKEAVEAAGLKYSINAGEGAFYGPKIEFVLTDCLEREWQCGTLQVDFMLPERLEAYYTDADGSKKHPVMLHRAILGTFERFIGILLEHYAGKLPLWLAPVQILITAISEESAAYAAEVFSLLKAKGLRAKLDEQNKQVSYKIRFYSLQKVPVIWVVGRKEREEKTVSIRNLDQETVIVCPLKEAVPNLINAIEASRNLS